jgi:uncharacterized protein (DUF4415 family)
MPNKRATAPGEWHDPDDAPDMSTPYWKKIIDETPISSGSPLLPKRKISVTIDFDKDILEAFQKDGPGWQTRINAALREVLK